MKKHDICSIVVTYNRKELLLSNLKMTLSQDLQTDIIVVDNHGNDGTKEYLQKELMNFDDIQYFYLESNIGGAGGFNFGVVKAYEMGYNWIILMDDDGKPGDIHCFGNLFADIKKNKYKSSDLIMLNSLVTYNGIDLSFGFGHLVSIKELHNKKIIENDNTINGMINPFNGTIISRGLIEKIGYPNKDFFIKGDEIDYTLRAQNAGAIIKTIVSSDYRHPKVANMKTKRILGHPMHVFIEAPWKEYYSIRNNVYSIMKNGGTRKKTIFFLAKRIFCAIISKCNKIKTIKMQIRGYRDGMRGNLGATVKP